MLITERFVRQLGAVFVHCEFVTSFIFKKDYSPGWCAITRERVSLNIVLVFGEKHCDAAVKLADDL